MIRVNIDDETFLFSIYENRGILPDKRFPDPIFIICENERPPNESFLFSADETERGGVPYGRYSSVSMREILRTQSGNPGNII